MKVEANALYNELVSSSAFQGNTTTTTTTTPTPTSTTTTTPTTTTTDNNITIHRI